MNIGRSYTNKLRGITARVTVETDAYYELELTKAPKTSKVFRAVKNKKSAEAEAAIPAPYATIRIEKPRDLAGRVKLEAELAEWTEEE